MLEFNHDRTPFTDADRAAWVEAMCRYFASGDPKLLPRGVTFFRQRHHSDPCPLGEPPRGWENDKRPNPHARND